MTADLVPLRKRGTYMGLIGAYVLKSLLTCSGKLNAFIQGMGNRFRHRSTGRRCLLTDELEVALLYVGCTLFSTP